MDFILFNFFSTIENAAAILLMLAIFKYRVKDYIPQIILTALTMSLISHTMRFEFNNSSLVPLVTLITLFLFIWIAFRVAVLYAIIISVLGFVSYGLLETFVLYVLQLLNILSTELVDKPNTLEGYLLQVFSSFIACSITFFLRYKNYGFNWVPYSKSAKLKLKGDNILFFVVVIISVFVLFRKKEGRELL